MKNLKYYRMYESEEDSFEPIRKMFAKEQLSWLDKCTKGTWKYNPRTGKVDVNGSFICSGQRLTDFKDIEFGEVTEVFDCSRNQLTSLAGSPMVVFEFRCEQNFLKNLIGGPKDASESTNHLISGYFASDNELVSLEGSPSRIQGSMYLRDNLLETLIGGPEYVGGDFVCSGNMLKSLEGAPRVVGKDFSCPENYLVNLEGIPNEIGEDARLYGNQITSLKGIDNLKNLNALKSIGSLTENPLPKKISALIIDKMISDGIKYADALEIVWPDLDDNDRVILYEDLPNITDQQKDGYKKLKSYLGLKRFL